MIRESQPQHCPCHYLSHGFGPLTEMLVGYVYGNVREHDWLSALSMCYLKHNARHLETCSELEQRGEMSSYRISHLDAATCSLQSLHAGALGTSASFAAVAPRATSSVPATRTGVGQISPKMSQAQIKLHYITLYYTNYIIYYILSYITLYCIILYYSILSESESSTVRSVSRGV